MLLIIDNYDSFTYNLVQYFQCLNQEVTVFKNDRISIEDIRTLAPKQLVISPGPNSPNQAGISLSVIEHFYQKTPILGICLGHQCLAQFFGAEIVKAEKVIHGKTSALNHHKQGIFNNLPTPFRAMRYHSLVIRIASLPPCFAIDAWAEDGTIMAISHRQYPLYGLQFHPESILSEHGLELLSHFIKK